MRFPKRAARAILNHEPPLGFFLSLAVALSQKNEDERQEFTGKS